MPIAEARDAQAADSALRQVRHVDVQDHRVRGRSLDQPRDEIGGDARGAREIARRSGLHAQRHGDGGQAEKAPLDRRGDRPGIQHVIAEVRTVVDAGDDQIMVMVEEAGDGHMDAVRRGTVDEIRVGRVLGRPQRHVQGQRVAGAAAIAVWSHDRDPSVRTDRIDQRREPLGPVTIVV